MTLDADVVLRVRMLLSQGHSHRTIARLLGISRGSIASIAAGHGRFGAGADGGVDAGGSAVAVVAGVDERWLLPAAKARCPSCGGLVFLPCRLCFVRAWMEKRRKRGR